MFFRYCYEIAFFPELTLSGTGGLVGAFFAFAILFAFYIFIACFIPSLMFGTAVWRWEGVRRQRLALMRKVTIWMTVASIILPLGFVKLAASSHKFWHRHPNYVLWLVALVTILIVWSLSQVIGTRWINVVSRKAETVGNIRLTRELRIFLGIYGALWTTLSSAILLMAFEVGRSNGMFVTASIVFTLLIFGIRIAFETNRADQVFLYTYVVCLSFLPILAFPVVPSGMVKMLGLGNYIADVMIDKRYYETLQAEGIPLCASPSEEGGKSTGQPHPDLTCVQRINNDTLLLRNVRVLLRVGSQLVLQGNVAGGRATQAKHTSTIAIPTTQVLQLREASSPTP